MGVESSPKSVKTAGEASARVVVLAFDLGKAEIPKLPDMLEKALNSDEVQTGIQQTINQYFLARLADGKVNSDVLGSKDTIALLQAVIKDDGGKIEDAVLKQVKASPEFKKLEGAIKDFEAAIKSSPLGVWVDKNKAMVYVTGIALVVGGAAALFVTKTKSGVTDLVIGQLKGKQVPIVKVGNFSLSGALLAFKPETRTIGMGFTGTEKLESVKVSLTIGVIASSTGMQQVNGSVVVKSDKWSVNFAATETIPKKQTDLHLTLSFDDINGKPKVGVGMIMQGDKVTGGTLNASLNFRGVDIGLKGSEENKRYTGLLTATIPFP